MWRDVAFLVLVVSVLTIAVVLVRRALDRPNELRLGDELRGLLEGARSDAIQYARVAERLGTSLERSHITIGELAHRAPALLPPPTPGTLALRQLEALKSGGSSSYYGAPPAPRSDHETAIEAARGRELVAVAIGRRGGTDARLSRHLRTVADELLAGGLTPEEVAKRITEGDPLE